LSFAQRIFICHRATWWWRRGIRRQNSNRIFRRLCRGKCTWFPSHRLTKSGLVGNDRSTSLIERIKNN
jgi:hypothetical protein